MMDYEQRIQEFEKRLEHLINEYGLENRSNTPDFILAKYLVMCLVSVNHAIGTRDVWYGKPVTDGSLAGLPSDTK